LHHIVSEVSKTTIREAVAAKLGCRKLCTRLVPKILTDDHKTKRMVSAVKILTRCAQGGDEFLDSILSVDETWGFTTLVNPSNNQEEVMTWFKRQAAHFYDSGMQKLVPRLNKCFDNAGDYFEK
jgi:hypothetical protein